MGFPTIQTLLLFATILFLDPATPLEYPREYINELFPDLTYNPQSSPPAESPILPSPKSPNSSSLAPALFVIGDSSVDSGTNNFLGTFARADRPPYGRDFDTHRPTGRFCNGRVPVDYIALRLGLPFVPSYLGQTGSIEDMIQGVNYASAGAGIIFSSGSELGQHISLTQQIQQVMDTFQQFILSMGEDAAYDLISNSIFYISIGSNDYIHYYLRNVSNVQSLYLPWNFNQFLAQTLKQEIQNLYYANVRNVIVMGLAPLGCAPYYLWLYESKNGECVSTINDMIIEFNFAMRFMVEQLNQELQEANIVFCDAFEGSMDIIKNHQRHGFNATTDACCGFGKYRGWIVCISSEMACTDASNHIWWDVILFSGFNVTTDACCGFGKYRGWIVCISSEMACTDASNHIWWDQFHPTDAVNEILAENIWSNLHSSMCYPMNLQEMITQTR